MAKRKARSGGKKAKTSRKSRKAHARRSMRSKAPKRRVAPKAARRPARRKKAAVRARAPVRKAAARASAPVGKTPRLDRPRRTLDDADDTIPTPPSSLDMDRRGSAARTGRAELEQDRQVHGSMTRGITGGDVDVNLEQAYFSGDEAPGGDNPTPDQDVVDDIGRAIGVEYQDNEELRASDKVADRDKHRWELDPASAEDYKERK
jgi:Family of unknown function (DUF6335)